MSHEVLKQCQTQSKHSLMVFVLLLLLWLVLSLSLACPVINLIIAWMCARSFFHHIFFLILFHTMALHWCFSWETLHYMYHTILSFSALPLSFFLNSFFWKATLLDFPNILGGWETLALEKSCLTSGREIPGWRCFYSTTCWFGCQSYMLSGEAFQVDICMPHDGNSNQHCQLKINILDY